MKNKILTLILSVLLIVPSMFLFTACQIGNSPAEVSMYGDVNLDGNVTAIDISQLNAKVLSGHYFSEQQMLNADVNADGKVDSLDLIILKAYLADSKSVDFPYSTNVVYGDVNGDGLITNADVLKIKRHMASAEYALTLEEKLNADLNLDGEINYIDVQILYQYIYDSSSIELPCVTNITYGDVNGDGLITNTDILKILRHMQGVQEFTLDQRLSADVNCDTQVNNIDVLIIFQYIYNNQTPIPYTTNVLIGDVNLDGEVTEADLTLLQSTENGGGLSLDARINADVNRDTQVNAEDITALEELLQNA